MRRRRRACRHAASFAAAEGATRRSRRRVVCEHLRSAAPMCGGPSCYELLGSPRPCGARTPSPGGADVGAGRSRPLPGSDALCSGRLSVCACRARAPVRLPPAAPRTPSARPSLGCPGARPSRRLRENGAQRSSSLRRGRRPALSRECRADDACGAARGAPRRCTLAGGRGERERGRRREISATARRNPHAVRAALIGRPRGARVPDASVL